MSSFDIQIILNEIEEFTPEIGFDLVGIDPFGIPGESLYFIDHFETKEAAEAEQKIQYGEYSHIL
ncbi:MAG: hypothetical protein HY223_03325 [Thaumarchaeota archaeon]|nr:hypothetical protein [Nitrososphaerota archaeon]